MEKLLSCAFNIDTANMELRYSDGSMISIDCSEVEYEFAHTVSQRSELDYLAYNVPLDYAKLVLGELSQTGIWFAQRFLRTVCETRRGSGST